MIVKALFFARSAHKCLLSCVIFPFLMLERHLMISPPGLKVGCCHSDVRLETALGRKLSLVNNFFYQTCSV